MSLRILVKPDQIQRWIEERRGTPARRRGSETDVRVLFDRGNNDYDPVSFDELIETMKFRQIVMLVDQQAGQTFHKFYRHG
jgi:hypothetical protein